MRNAILASLAVAAMFSAATAAAQPTIPGVERRLTTNLADQAAPAISRNIVVYTDWRGSDENVWYYDLATGTEHPATTANGNQELADVSEGVIVYADLSLMHIFIYDVASGTTADLNAGRTSMAYDPAVGQGLVAWVDNRDGNYEIYARDLSTNEERRLSYSGEPDQTPAVRNGTVAWTRCETLFPQPTLCRIFAHDWATGVTRQITQLTGYQGRHDRLPDVDSGRVVFQGEDANGSDIYHLDLASGVETRLALPGNQGNPHISGDFVSFDDLSTGLYHVRLWHVPSGQVFDVPVNPATQQYLNRIDGHRIVYTDDRNGQLDVYMYEFAYPLSASPSSYDFGDVVLFTQKQACVDVTNISVQDLFIMPRLTPGTSPPFLIDLKPPLEAGGYLVQAGATFCVPVVFLPLAAGPAATDLTIYAFNPLVPVLTVHLTGNGVPTFGSVDVVPTSHSFPDVELGAAESTQVTISNVSDRAPLIVVSIAFAAGSSPAFELGSAPTCPFLLPPASGGVAATADVEIRFRPAVAGPASATLEIRSDDVNHPSFTVSLNGTGVHTPTPTEAAANLLTFFDESVETGRLSGSGPGNSAQGRLTALRNMLRAAAELVKKGRSAGACQQYLDAYERVDGLPRPPDFASGPSAAELAALILELRARLGCE